MESVLRPEESRWWERFVKETYVLRREWKSKWAIDGKGGELTEWEDVLVAPTRKSDCQRKKDCDEIDGEN